jgi:hypothetical protein
MPCLDLIATSFISLAWCINSCHQTLRYRSVTYSRNEMFCYRTQISNAPFHVGHGKWQHHKWGRCTCYCKGHCAAQSSCRTINQMIHSMRSGNAQRRRTRCSVLEYVRDEELKVLYWSNSLVSENSRKTRLSGDNGGGEELHVCEPDLCWNDEKRSSRRGRMQNEWCKVGMSRCCGWSWIWVEFRKCGGVGRARQTEGFWI